MKQSIKLNSTRQNIWVFSNTLRTLNSKHHTCLVGDSVLRFKLCMCVVYVWFMHLFSSCITCFPAPVCNGLLSALLMEKASGKTKRLMPSEVFGKYLHLSTFSVDLCWVFHHNIWLMSSTHLSLLMHRLAPVGRFLACNLHSIADGSFEVDGPIVEGDAVHVRQAVRQSK